MTTQTLTLSEFLLARIAADEAALDWSHMVESVADEFEYATDAHMFLASGLDDIPPMTRARLLAECEAKRRIVKIHHQPEDLNEVDNLKRGPTWGCVCYMGWPCPTLRFLALPYADSPDYRQEWRP